MAAALTGLFASTDPALAVAPRSRDRTRPDAGRADRTARPGRAGSPIRKSFRAGRPDGALSASSAEPRGSRATPPGRAAAGSRRPPSWPGIMANYRAGHHHGGPPARLPTRQSATDAAL